MGLLSFFQRRKAPADAARADAGDEVAAARTRARRRLMGAAVLVMVGVIGFPLVFETQPRPIPVDIPIEIPRRDGAPVLAMPPARDVAARASEAAPAVPEARPPASAAESPKAGVAAAPAERPEPAPRPAPAVETRPEPRPAATPDSARARALLEGKEPEAARVAAARTDDAPSGNGRYVVQVGAFAEAAAAREMRSRVEKLGLKTYTQVVQTSAGSRIRVRVGPFSSREEAERALAKAKSAGLNAVVLTL